MRIVIAAAALAVVLPGPGRAAGSLIQTLCQKNVEDGRILIQDYKVLPHDDSTFKVLSFRRTGGNDLWAEGPCTIKVTGRAR